jgi:formyl-CoA transferase
MPALDGLRILDMTQYEAGTSCTQWLAWLGADVVKLERPGAGDPGRHIDGGEQDSAYFLYWNSNKRSVAIDLNGDTGRDLLLQMLPHYDVFVENYGPGVMEKLRLDYDRLKSVHPTLIYARIKGFGTDGPYSAFKCYDPIAQAVGGAFSITGAADGPPVRPGPTLSDSGSGVQLALAITAAYVQRLREGIGQEIEVSMQEATTYFLRTTIATGGDWGRQAAARSGNGFGATANLYPCAPGGPNDHVYILAFIPRHMEAMCHAIGRADLLEVMQPGFSDDNDAGADADAYEQIAKWTRERSKYDVMQILGDAGVPCGAVLDTKDLFVDPHLLARGFIQKIQHEEQGELPVLGSPIRLSESRVPLRAAPLLGRHTAEVLREDLELDEARLSDLRRDGVIAF